MWKRIKSSLTARIFLLTCALFIAVSALTYGMIAYLTPLSYTNILESELSARIETLMEALSKVNPQDSMTLLSDFVRQTGAEASVLTEDGDMLFETIPAPDAAFHATSEGAEIHAGSYTEVMRDTSIAQSGGLAMQSETQVVVEADSASETGGAVVDESVAAVESAGKSFVRSFAFEDGTRATLTVQGGVRAVNQATEALGRVLPYLACTILLISLAASFFYARFITRPIVSISAIARRLSKLDFAARWMGRRNDEIGTLGGSLNLLSDNLSHALSNLSEANRQLQSDIDRERELERQRMAFIAAASHELKTPITILKGQLSGMLARVGIYQDREKYLARALAVTARMESLVKEILMINRIEAASFALKARRVNLSELMQAQLSLDGELIQQKNLILKADIRPNVFVQGDEALLSNAIGNVLINAILYSPAGASIHVAVQNDTFSVENTGTSIPEDALSSLFTPFYRVEQSRSRKSGGSGLGLYLVKSILDLHGVVFTIENTHGGVLCSAVFPGRRA